MKEGNVSVDSGGWVALMAKHGSQMAEGITYYRPRVLETIGR